MAKGAQQYIIRIWQIPPLHSPKSEIAPHHRGGDTEGSREVGKNGSGEVGRTSGPGSPQTTCYLPTPPLLRQLYSPLTSQTYVNHNQIRTTEPPYLQLFFLRPSLIEQLLKESRHQGTPASDYFSDHHPQLLEWLLLSER